LGGRALCQGGSERASPSRGALNPCARSRPRCLRGVPGLADNRAANPCLTPCGLGVLWPACRSNPAAWRHRRRHRVKSQNLIRPSNLAGAWDPSTFWGHHVVLAPIFAIHEGARIQRLRRNFDTAFYWEWSRRAATIEALGVIWNMTGRWNARRPVTCSRPAFDKCVGDIVPSLADFFNCRNIAHLADIAQLEEPLYSRVVRRIHWAVASISALRHTRHVEPVLGSKVLHHYFPSIVPVFDTRFIRNGVMRDAPYRESFDGWGEWRVFADEHSAGGPSMLDFHHYFGFCAWQIGTATPKTLGKTRTQFARAFQVSAPTSMVSRRGSVLWCLDAKIAEYCAVNHAEAHA